MTWPYMKLAGSRSPSIVVPKGPGHCLTLQGELETFFRGVSDTKGQHVTVAKLRILFLGLPAGLGPVTASKGKETDKNGRGEHVLQLQSRPPAKVTETFQEGTPNNQGPGVTVPEPTVPSMGLPLPPRLVPLL